MPRPKGSKNKKRIPRIKLVQSTVSLLAKLSEDSGLPVNKVLDDAIVEGIAELREETYKGLIDFNLNRRGKVYHEREPEKLSRESAREHQAPGAETDTGADPDRRGAPGVQPGHTRPVDENSGLSGGEQNRVEPGTLERDALSRDQLDQLERTDFEQAGFEPLTNHPPFVVPPAEPPI